MVDDESDTVRAALEGAFFDRRAPGDEKDAPGDPFGEFSEVCLGADLTHPPLAVLWGKISPTVAAHLEVCEPCRTARDGERVVPSEAEFWGRVWGHVLDGMPRHVIAQVGRLLASTDGEMRAAVIAQLIARAPSSSPIVGAPVECPPLSALLMPEHREHVAGCAACGAEAAERSL